MLLRLTNTLFRNLTSATLQLLWISLWILGLVLLVWYPLRWWPGDRLQPVQILNYFMPWLLLGLVPALTAAGLGRRVRLAATLAVPTLLISLNFAPLFLPRLDYALASNTPFKVMSYNVLFRNRDLPALLSVIRQEQPDILLLQEVTPTIAETLNSLDKLYPAGGLYFVYESQINQAIISRYPLTPIETAPEQGRVQKVRVDTPHGPLQVWNVHLSVPVPWSRQYREVIALVEDIATVNEPLIVGGDFNTTYGSEVYSLLNQALENAHWQAGWGFGFTFPAHKRQVKGVPILTPVVRIDHIFHGPHFFSLAAYTLTSAGGSDHLPVVAELLLVE